MTTPEHDKKAKPSPRPGRAKRLLRRGLELGVVAVAVGWFVQSILLPWLIRDKVTAALSGLGFENAHFDVRSASFWQTRLADLSAADGDLRVGTLDVSYRPLAAASGELDVIRLGGAEVRLTIRDGNASLRPPAAASSPSTSTASQSADASLPFARLEIVSSALRLDWEGREFWLPVSGTVNNRGHGIAELQLASFAFGSPLEIAGTIDLRRGTSHVTGSAGQVDLAALLASVPEAFGPPRVRAGGRAAVRVVHDRGADGAATITAGFEPKDVWLTADAGGRSIAVDGLSMSSQVVLDDAFNVIAVDATGSVAGIRVGDETLREAAFAVRGDGPAIEFATSARGDGWHVDKLDGTVTGLLGPQPGRNVGAEISLTGGGPLPPVLLAKLNAAGVDAAELGEARVQASAKASVTRSAADIWRWKADVPKLQLTLPPGDLAGPGGAKLQGLAGVLNVGGTFGPDGGDVFLLDDSWIGFRALAAGAGDNATRVGGTRIALAGGDGGRVASVRFAEDGTRIRTKLRAATDDAVTLKGPGTDANLGQLSFGGTVSMDPGAIEPNVDLRIDITGAAASHAASGLSLADISASVPVTFNAAMSVDAGTFEIASITLGEEKLDPLRGTLDVRDGRAMFSANWQVLPEAVLDVDGWLASAPTGLAGEINAKVPSFRLDDEDALADRIHALDGWAVTGTFAADAKLQIAGGSLAPRVTLKVSDADARSADVGVNLKGLSGDVTVDSFAPLGSAARQELAVKEVAFGNVKMTDAALAFRLEPGAVQFERVEAGWLGGRVLTHGLRVDFAAPKFETTLYAENLSLKEILAFAAEGRATGEGVMFGKLPVAVEWPRVQLGRGYLRSQSRAGEIQVLDTKLLAETMERSDPRFTSDPDLVEVKNRVVRALSDFEYDALTFNFDEESGGLVRINTHGKGRAGDRPQELDMTLNVRGANDLLNHYLQMKTKWDELSK